jgi:Kef-type K+ transport system membrane component KefB
MANTFTAPFAQTPKTATAVVTAVATLTDTPANTVLLVTAGSDGAIVTRLTAIPRATVTASSLVVFISKDSGTTQRLIDAELMAAYTMATTTLIPETTFSLYTETTPLRLEAGDRIYVGSQVALAGGIVFRAEFTNF